jgi:hypothetical protein
MSLDYPHLKYRFGWGESGRYWGWEATYRGLKFGLKSYCKVTKKQMRSDAADLFAEIVKHCPNGK